MVKAKIKKLNSIDSNNNSLNINCNKPEINQTDFFLPNLENERYQLYRQNASVKNLSKK